MKRLVLSFLVIPLLLPGSANGQSNDQGKSAKLKASTISAKVSPDGKSLIGQSGEPWLVANPAMLVGHEGQLVKVKCELTSGGHALHVVSVKTLATQTKYAVNLGDAAFRR